MKLRSFLLKLTGWQRAWVVFSVLSLVVVGPVVANGFPNSDLTAEEVRRLVDPTYSLYKVEIDSLSVRRVKFGITWFIAWLGLIGVTYAGGIAVNWVIKGFQHNRRG